MAAALKLLDHRKGAFVNTTPDTGLPPGTTRHRRWNKRLAAQIAALLIGNLMADTVLVAPLLFLPQMLEHFQTDQAAWISSSAVLAGALWAPLLGRSADLHGKRRMLVITLLIGCTGAVICVIAPNMLIFTLGRLAQGAVIASVFLSAAIVRELCEPRIAMPAVGIVTTGTAVLNLGAAFLYENLVAEFGFRIIFVTAAALGAIAAVAVRAVIPESTTITPGRLDVGGALLLGAGLVTVLGYISLGPEIGWFGVIPFAFLGAGVTTLAYWVRHSRRATDPVIDISDLGRPLLLTLLVIVLATGATQSMDQLLSLIAQVSHEQRLGYGLDAQGMLGLLFGIPAVGVVVGGVLSGWLATRIGPAATLAAATTVGTAGAAGMLTGASWLPAAIACSFLLQCTMGALLTTGFNLAGSLVPAHRQAAVSSMVAVVGAFGSVVMTFVGAAVLSSTQTIIDGTAVNSATGVYSYIAIATATLATATVLAVGLTRRRSSRFTAPDGQPCSGERSASLAPPHHPR
ncbi:MFS transporter [Nocardia rhamnosiphila]|uniref:MFS transporter n=1 Tax=Nocardia rhamnosiphila TaxID=426716 RepID=UPI00340E5C03